MSLQDHPPLDLKALDRLHRLGGDAFVCKMIDLFLDYAQKKISEAREAQRAADLAGVERAAHPLKSSAGNVGAEGVREMARQLESFAMEARADQVEPTLAKLEQAFREAKPLLEEHRKKYAVNPP